MTNNSTNRHLHDVKLRYQFAKAMPLLHIFKFGISTLISAKFKDDVFMQSFQNLKLRYFGIFANTLYEGNRNYYIWLFHTPYCYQNRNQDKISSVYLSVSHYSANIMHLAPFAHLLHQKTCNLPKILRHFRFGNHIRILRIIFQPMVQHFACLIEIIFVRVTNSQRHNRCQILWFDLKTFLQSNYCQWVLKKREGFGTKYT